MCAIVGGMHVPRPTGRSEDSSVESVLSSFLVGSGDRSESLGFCGKCHSSPSKLTGLQNSGSYQTGSWIPSPQWKVLVSLWQKNYRRPVSHNLTQRGRGVRTQHSPHSQTRCYELRLTMFSPHSSLSKYHDPWPLVAVGPWKRHTSWTSVSSSSCYINIQSYGKKKKTKLIKRS